MSIRFEKIWVQQCKATKGIKKRFGVKSALDYLIGEKLLNFADAAEQRPGDAETRATPLRKDPFVAVFVLHVDRISAERQHVTRSEEHTSELQSRVDISYA